MKKFLVMLLLAVWTAASSFGAFNALKPKGEAVKIDPAKITDIVLPANFGDKEKYAANLLNMHWKKLTGKRLKIARDLAKVKQNAFILKPADPALGDDGYSIEVVDGNVVLSGGSRRAAINAVIALLEEDMGVRWFVKGDEVCYPAEVAGGIELVPRKYIPVLINREPFYFDAFDPDFETMNRLNQSWSASVPENIGGSWNFPKAGFVHTMDSLLPNSLFAAHPEYFALIDGKRQINRTGKKCANPCLTNPDAIQVMAENAIAMLKANPNSEIISISTNDGSGGFCQCEKCIAVQKKEGHSGVLLLAVNQIAYLVNQVYPDVKIDTLAYLETFEPPKTVRPGKNVYIRLCTDAHAWRYPLFSIDESKPFYNALQAWNRIGANLLIWDYNVEFGNFLRLRPNLWVTDRNLDILLENNVKGVMYQGAFLSPGGASAPMYVWIMSKRLWNPEWKLDDLINDFCEGYYGAAAPAMKDFVTLQKREWQRFHDQYKDKDIEKIRPQFQFSDNFLPEFKAIIDRAYEAVKGDELLTGRIMREDLNYTYMRLEKGPKDKDDVDAFRADLKKFAEMIKTFKVTRMSENGSDQINNKLVALECNITDTLDRPIGEKSIRICPHSVYIWPVEMALRAKYENIDGRPVLTQPGGKSSWCLQWHFTKADNLIGINSYRGLFPGKKYKIRLVARADADPGAGDLLSASYYSIGSGKILGTTTINASSLLGDEFIDVTGPEFTFEPNGYFYVTPANNPKCKKIYFDYMEIIPAD